MKVAEGRDAPRYQHFRAYLGDPAQARAGLDLKRVNFDERRWPPLRSIKMNLPSSERVSGIRFGES
jgi:hypothetical protein